MSQHERHQKIVKMKLQTAKVLWQEDRKDAAFLVLESVNDPQADQLRIRMGFDDTYEVGQVASRGVSWAMLGIVLVIVIVVSFLVGSLVEFGGANPSEPELVSEDEFIATIIAPTLEAGEPLTQPMLELTGTASQLQLTQAAIANQQDNSMNLLNATETARYEQATATEHARGTQAAGQ